MLYYDQDDKTTINPVNLSKFDNLESSSGSSGSESNLKEDSTATTTDNDLQQVSPNNSHYLNYKIFLNFISLEGELSAFLFCWDLSSLLW